MGMNYGVTFASKLIEDGKYEEALVAATQHAERDPKDPEPFLDRAVALFNLERYGDAVAAVVRSMEIDEVAGTLESDLVDDTLFGALLGEARRVASSDLAAALAGLRQYEKIMPEGRHVADVASWSARLRGEGTNDVIVKERI